MRLSAALRNRISAVSELNRSTPKSGGFFVIQESKLFPLLTLWLIIGGWGLG